MKWKFALLGAVLAMAPGLTGAAVAGSNDYNFEPVPAEVKKGNGVTITVRLVHRPSGKAVPDAIIYASRMDMSPEGMATMAAPLTPVAGGESGTYTFKTDLVMAGQWLLSLSARVQGEPEVVQAKITFKATN